MDLTTYTKRVFFMNPGEQRKVSLRFDRKLLDSVVNADIEISNQFFGWLASFGTKVKIMYPQLLAEEYTVYLQEIIHQHQE